MPKPTPKYWWDFTDDFSTAVVVQSDYPGGEELARFEYTDSATHAIEEAEKLIDDFKSGRKTPNWNNNSKTTKSVIGIKNTESIIPNRFHTNTRNPQQKKRL